MNQSSFYTAAAVCGLLATASLNPAFAGMNKTETQRFQALTADVQNLSADHSSRISRLERLLESSNLQQMYQQMQTLDEENRQLRGRVEELSHQLERLKEREQKMNLDVDNRLQQLESSRSPVTSMMPAEGYGDSQAETYHANDGYAANDVMNVLDEQSQYRQSFEFLKSGQYPAAIASFQQFLQAYPESSMAPNAQYWLGEANYGAGKFEQAVTNFETVRQNYPGTAKVPDASLKLGYSLYELSQWSKAKSVLQDVVSQHPGSSAANLATTRLQRIKQEGH